MKYNFCPKCGNPLELRHLEGRERMVCTVCAFIFYQNSKPCVSALILDEQDRLLLIQRAIEPYRDHWDIVGGFLEAGEEPQVGTQREAREETGLEIEITHLLGVYADTYADDALPTLNVSYIARVIGGVAQAGSDAKAMHWFALDALPTKIAFPQWSWRTIADLKEYLKR